jgi:hypothetical protein
MSDYDKMKIGEMRKMLREHRKTSAVPVSKMSKIALMKELDKFAATPSTMPSHAPVEKARTEVSKQQIAAEEGKVATKKKAEKVVVGTGVQGVTQHAPKKEVKSEAVQQNPVARAKLVKGSSEAREFMASIRMKKTKKDNVE